MNHPASSHTVPVLITWDADPDEWIPLDNRLQALRTAMDLCRRHEIRATFFVTATAAEAYRDEIARMQHQGHEVGCHGLTHGTEENYDQMPEAMQRAYIGQATEQLQAVTGVPIQAFRAPRVKVGAPTMKVLVEHGYRVDSSVCSQRIDFVSSNLINLGWVFAPRRPYRPRADNVFRAGDMPIWEAPVSATGAPFISTLLRIFSVGMLKILFRLLYIESHHTGKPIVYLAHPAEFVSGGGGGGWKQWRDFIEPEYFKPSFIRAHGLRLRNLFYRASGQMMIEYTRELLAYMASFPDVVFMTVGDYTAQYLGNIWMEDDHA
ncbi:MAG: polysaccharide deacetylase family protein [Anaerolineales bacterium]